MVAIHPFRALRYDPERAGELSRLIAPPYDVIGEAEQERLYQTSPHNIVRLTLGKQRPEDSEDDNRYSRARREYDGWRAQAILRQDETPACYLIEHTFQDAGLTRTRLGFLALLELSDAMERIAYRHEATFSAPKADRTKLLDAVPANLEPIFCVYPDRDGAIAALLKEQTRRSPPAADVPFNAEKVRLWLMTDPRLVEDIAHRLAPLTMLIADGHHRFEVAWAHRARYGSVMTYFVSMEDPGLAVRPIHRVIRPGGGSGVLETLQNLCAMERVPDLAALVRWLREEQGEGCFGIYDGRAFYRVQMKADQLARWLMSPSVPMALATLDVSLLHGLLLPSIDVDGPGIRYTPETSEATRMTEAEQGSLAWLLRGISLPQVYALASQGFSLPPKSTYFYPKVPSGLTIHPLA